MFLINVLHVYLFFRGFSFQHALIRNNTFINFQEIFLQTHLFGPINLNIFEKSENIGLKTVFKGLFLTDTMIFRGISPQHTMSSNFSSNLHQLISQNFLKVLKLKGYGNLNQSFHFWSFWREPPTNNICPHAMTSLLNCNFTDFDGSELRRSTKILIKYIIFAQKNLYNFWIEYSSIEWLD